MLSVSTVKNAAKAGDYYTKEDNYLVLGDKSTEWYGAGAESLGLEGPVDKATFVSILEGRLPDGSDLSWIVNGVNKHRHGYDLTFSAPKSVSILALVYDDKFLIEAFRESVSETLDIIEQLSTTRTKKDGIPVMERTGNLVMARFLHGTNLSREPHMHEHVVIANITLAKNGWKTLSSDIQNKMGFTDEIWSQRESLSVIQLAFLRKKIESKGGPTVTTSDKGTWEIEGVPIDVFSSESTDENLSSAESVRERVKENQVPSFSIIPDEETFLFRKKSLPVRLLDIVKNIFRGKNQKLTLLPEEDRLKKYLISYAINVSLRESDAFQGMHEYIGMFRSADELPKRNYPLLYWWVKTDGENGSPVLSVNTPRIIMIMDILVCSEEINIDNETLKKVISQAVSDFRALNLSVFNESLEVYARMYGRDISPLQIQNDEKAAAKAK
ncbi:MobF family relaxase [Pantoea sp. BAV 3049]|uniref:MobF family relaxase n=1 Tax=Pantoea sp. BAV 3049 TaxID=2654188 RepID=UPI001E62D415|nr:MobF family relaxase [Pantoea sp. BAV 3049]